MNKIIIIMTIITKKKIKTKEIIIIKIMEKIREKLTLFLLEIWISKLKKMNSKNFLNSSSEKFKKPDQQNTKTGL